MEKTAREVLIASCRQGIGRTGLAAVCLLVNKGWESDATIELLSAARGAVIPETQGQRRWIEKYAAQVGATHLHAEPKR